MEENTLNQGGSEEDWEAYEWWRKTNKDDGGLQNAHDSQKEVGSGNK